MLWLAVVMVLPQYHVQYPAEASASDILPFEKYSACVAESNSKLPTHTRIVEEIKEEGEKALPVLFLWLCYSRFGNG
ncbi:MAG: hypothetical protein JO210_07750 [Acidobacteriaceae bacterium]|nr:hypothetical protein [Acidobacteriaceae bacterium]